MQHICDCEYWCTDGIYLFDVHLLQIWFGVNSLDHRSHIEFVHVLPKVASIKTITIIHGGYVIVASVGEYQSVWCQPLFSCVDQFIQFVVTKQWLSSKQKPNQNQFECWITWKNNSFNSFAYPKNVETIMSTLATGNEISATFPLITVIFSDKLLSTMTRRANWTMFELSIAYTCFAPAIALNIDKMPKSQPTLRTICKKRERKVNNHAMK